MTLRRRTTPGLQDRGIVIEWGLHQSRRRRCDVLRPARLFGETRLVADAEYLSSYAYREAFAESFNQAVSSDILSIVVWRA